MLDIHDYREFDKMGLDTFLMDLDFPDLEKDLIGVIQEIEFQIKKNLQELSDVYNTSELPDKENSLLQLHYNEVLKFQEDRIYGIYEMIIINDYKEFEIVLKKLLKASLGLSKKNLYFGEVKTFLKDKGINLPEVDCYDQINNLRKLNNYLKHSKITDVPDELGQIKEFRNKKEINYEDLRGFHQRVQAKRFDFIYSLKGKIYNYLYHFDNNRIEKIAKKMYKRMNHKHIELLIEKLQTMK